MCSGNRARTLRDILAPVLVSVVIPTALIASQEVRRVVLRVQSTYVTTYQTHNYCRLALDWCHSFSPKDCHQGLTLVLFLLAPISKTDSWVCWRKQECLKGELRDGPKWHLIIAETSMIIACIHGVSGWRGERRAQLRTETWSSPCSLSLFVCTL